MVDSDGAGGGGDRGVWHRAKQTLTLYTPAGLAKVFISGAASASSAVERKSAGLMREVSVKLLRPAVRPSFIATVVEKLLEPISKKVTGFKARPRLQRQTSIRSDARVEMFGVSAQPDVCVFWGPWEENQGEPAEKLERSPRFDTGRITDLSL